MSKLNDYIKINMKYDSLKKNNQIINFKKISFKEINKELKTINSKTLLDNYYVLINCGIERMINVYGIKNIEIIINKMIKENKINIEKKDPDTLKDYLDEYFSLINNFFILKDENEINKNLKKILEKLVIEIYCDNSEDKKLYHLNDDATNFYNKTIAKYISLKEKNKLNQTLQKEATHFKKQNKI